MNDIIQKRVDAASLEDLKGMYREIYLDDFTSEEKSEEKQKENLAGELGLKELVKLKFDEFRDAQLHFIESNLELPTIPMVLLLTKIGFVTCWSNSENQAFVDGVWAFDVNNNLDKFKNLSLMELTKASNFGMPIMRKPGETVYFIPLATKKNKDLGLDVNVVYETNYIASKEGFWDTYRLFRCDVFLSKLNANQIKVSSDSTLSPYGGLRMIGPIIEVSSLGLENIREGLLNSDRAYKINLMKNIRSNPRITGSLSDTVALWTSSPEIEQKNNPITTKQRRSLG